MNRPGCRSCCNPVPQAPHGCLKLVGEDSFRASDGTWRTGEEYIDYIIEEKMVTSGFPSLDAHMKSIVKQDDHEYKARFSCYAPSFRPSGPTQSSSGNAWDEIMLGNDAWGYIWPTSWTATFGFSDVIVKSYLDIEVENVSALPRDSWWEDGRYISTTLEDDLVSILRDERDGDNLKNSATIYVDDYEYFPPLEERAEADIPCSPMGTEVPGTAIGIGPNRKCYAPDTYRAKPHPDKPGAFILLPWTKTEVVSESHYIVSYREVYIDDELVYTSKRRYLFKQISTQRGYKPSLPATLTCGDEVVNNMVRGAGYPAVGCYYPASHLPYETGACKISKESRVQKEGTTGSSERDLFTITANYPEVLEYLSQVKEPGRTSGGAPRDILGDADHYSNFDFCLAKNYMVINDVTLNYSIPSQAFQYATIESNDFVILNPFTGSLGRPVDPDALPPHYYQSAIGLEPPKSWQEKMLNADFDRLGITVDEADTGRIKNSKEVLEALGIEFKYVCVPNPNTGWPDCHWEYQDANGNVVPREEIARLLSGRSTNKRLYNSRYEKRGNSLYDYHLVSDVSHVTVPVHDSMIPLDDDDVQRAIDALGDPPEEFIEGEPNPAYKEWLDEVDEIKYVNDEKKRIYRRALTLNFNIMNYLGNHNRMGRDAWAFSGSGVLDSTLWSGRKYLQATEDTDVYNKPISLYTLTEGYIRAGNNQYFKLADFFTSFVNGKLQLAYTDNFPAVDGAQFLLVPEVEASKKLIHDTLGADIGVSKTHWRYDELQVQPRFAPQKVIYASGVGGKLMVGEEVFYPSGSPVVWIIVQVNKAGPNGDTTYWLRKKSNPQQAVLASEHNLDFREEGNKRYYWSTVGVINLQTTYLEDEFADPFLYRVVEINFHNGGAAKVPLTATGRFRFVDGFMRKYKGRDGKPLEEQVSDMHLEFSEEHQRHYWSRNLQGYSWGTDDFDKQPWHDYITLVSMYGRVGESLEDTAERYGVSEAEALILAKRTADRSSRSALQSNYKSSLLYLPQSDLWFTPDGKPGFPYPRAQITGGAASSSQYFDYDYELDVPNLPPKVDDFSSTQKPFGWWYKRIPEDDQGEASKYNIVTQTPQYFQTSDDSYLEFILEPVIGGQGAVNEMRQLGFNMNPPEAIKGDGNPPALEDNLANPFLAAKFNPVNPRLDPNAAAQQGAQLLKLCMYKGRDTTNPNKPKNILKYFDYPLKFEDISLVLKWTETDPERNSPENLYYWQLYPGPVVAYPDERVKKLTQKQALKRNWPSIEAANEVIFDDYTETLGSNCIIVADEPSEIWESVPANIKVLEDADLQELVANGIDGGCENSDKKLDYSNLMDRLQEEYDKNTESFPELNEDNNIDVGTECYVGFPCFWSKTARAVEPYPEGLYGINKPYEELPQVLDYRYFAYAEFRGKLYPVMKGIIVKVVKIMTDEELSEDPSINELLNTMSLTNGPKHVIQFSRAEDYGWGETMETLWTGNRNLLPDTYEGDRKSYINFYTEYPGGGFMHIPAGAASAQLFPIDSCDIIDPKDEL
jgi:hypothetical protein